MKTVYESILTSTNAGAVSMGNQIEEWVKSLSSYNTVDKFVSVKVVLEKSGFVVYYKRETDNRRNKSVIAFTKIDFENSLYNKKWNIAKFVEETSGRTADVVFVNVNVEDCNMPKEVDHSVTFIGCVVNISKLPKNCLDLYLKYMSSLSGGHGNRIVKPLKNMNIQNVFVEQHWRGQSSLATIVSSAFENCTIDYIEITDGMLGYYSVDKGNRKFSSSAEEILNEFDKKNNVTNIIYQYAPDKKKQMYDNGIVIKDKNGSWKVKPVMKK